MEAEASKFPSGGKSDTAHRTAVACQGTQQAPIRHLP